MSIGTKIRSFGSAFPETVMKNSDFEHFLDTSDEWIRTRTGIRERRIADPKKGESTLSICVGAAERALEKAGIQGSELDFILVGTVTPESLMPATAVQLQARLGAKKAFAFDLQAACSGWVYALSIADHFIRGGSLKKGLVIGAETLSTIVNWRDRTTCVLFGDGAGAAVVEATTEEQRVLATKLCSDGDYASLLSIPHGFAKVPTYAAEYRHEKHKIIMHGREVFKLAVRNMVETSKQLLKANEFTLEQVDFFVFHQANMRIIDTCMKMLGVSRDKTWINLDRYGNTSAATLPSCLDEAVEAGRIKSGDLILVATFGGGLTWASALFRL